MVPRICADNYNLSPRSQLLLHLQCTVDDQLDVDSVDKSIVVYIAVPRYVHTQGVVDHQLDINSVDSTVCVDIGRRSFALYLE